MNPLKSLIPLWVSLATTFKTVSQKSLQTFERRSSENSIMFLTQVLPQLGKDLDRALSSGLFVLTPNLLKKVKGRAYPVFLKEYWSRFFYQDGTLRDNIDPLLLKEFRTLCYFAYKFVIPFTPEQEDAAYNKFIATDNSVKTDFSDMDISSIRATFNSCLPDTPWDIRPHHSNGASANSVSNLEKRVAKYYDKELFQYFNISDIFQSKNHANAWLSSFKMKTESYPSVLTFVPKDARGPRSIGMEPHLKMFFQKGLQAKIYDYVENASPASGRINFTDQNINRRLAYLGSIDGSLSTIDLKDASDMVSWELIKQLVTTEWRDALTATRSHTIRYKNSDIRLKKFAPMGSALCFPIEAILFYSIATTITPEVWVYGDDIIVPTAYADDVMNAIERYGLIINRDKSLTQGFFRESCGGDYYKGYDITPIRLRSIDLDSFVAYSNLLSEAFGDETGEAAIRWFESIKQCIVLRLPYSHKDRDGFIAYYVPDPETITTPYGEVTVKTHSRVNAHLFKGRYNSDLQIFEIKALQTVPKIHNSKIQVNGHSYYKKEYQPLVEYDLLFDWFTTKEKSLSPISDNVIRNNLESITYQARNYKCNQLTTIRDILGIAGKPASYGQKKDHKLLWGELITHC